MLGDSITMGDKLSEMDKDIKVGIFECGALSVYPPDHSHTIFSLSLLVAQNDNVLDKLVI